MNILMLSEAPYPEHGGGAGRFSYLLARQLVRQGHNVHLLWCGSRESRPPYSLDGIQVHKLPDLFDEGIAPRDVEHLTAKNLLDYIEANIPMASVDVVHDTCGFFSYFFPLAHWLQQLYCVPVITHFEYLQYQNEMPFLGLLNPSGMVYLFFEEKRYETPQCFATRIANRIVCPSKSEAEFVQRIYSPPPGSLVVMPNPVELFSPLPESVAATREKLARSGERLILFGGRIGSHQKNSPAVLGAVRRLRVKHPEVRLVLATYDEEEVERYRRTLGEAVTPVGWIRDAKEMAQILAAVDVVVMPSVYESFGQMASEAMAVGTPVVVSPVGAMPELIRDGENGFILGPDPRQWEQELRGRLVTLLEDADRARAMGKEGRRTVESTITVERVTEQLEELYGELADMPRSRRKELALPVLGPEQRETYLRRLSSLGAGEARRAGESVLAHWPDTVERRCLTCSHHRIAADTQTLVRLPRERFWNWLPWWPSRSETVNDAVTRACPLALLQKEHLRTGRFHPFSLKQIIKMGLS